MTKAAGKAGTLGKWLQKWLRLSGMCQCVFKVCFVAQPNTTDKQGNVHTWHIPTTAHVVISLALATRLTGVRVNSHFVFASYSRVSLSGST